MAGQWLGNAARGRSLPREINCKVKKKKKNREEKCKEKREKWMKKKEKKYTALLYTSSTYNYIHPISSPATFP